jgi:hypothetical protein
MEKMMRPIHPAPYYKARRPPVLKPVARRRPVGVSNDEWCCVRALMGLVGEEGGEGEEKKKKGVRFNPLRMIYYYSTTTE